MTIPASTQVKVKFDQYKLANGLTVILHEDHSVPVTAVMIQYHVGSKNEKMKRTGFAHLFEHMMFKGSQHVKDGEHFKLLQEIGANINGFTNSDGTTYFEVLPSNYVELGLYLESDRLGFLLQDLNQAKLDNQRDVVKNERRQNYDNRPYGTADEKIAKAIYPPTHPYSWPTIGSMEDLSAASLEDVKDFFRTYYAPNNAVLVLAGDIKPEIVKSLIEKYFGPIPAGKSFDRPGFTQVTMPVVDPMVYEDKVQLARLYLTWHTVPAHTPDDPSLDVLANLLSHGKTSRLYKALVYDKQIAQNVMASQSSQEIAGTFDLEATAKPGQALPEIQAAIDSIIGDVLAHGVTQREVDNALTAVEVGVVNSLQTDYGKALALASFYSYVGDPGFINKQLDEYKNVTPETVLAAAKKYLAQPKFTLSVVPMGKTELAVQKGK